MNRSTPGLCVHHKLPEFTQTHAHRVGDAIQGREDPPEGPGYLLQFSWASLVAQLVKNAPTMWETWVRSLGWQIPRKKERLPTLVFWPGEFHGLYSPWGHKKSERPSLSI